MRPQNVFTVVLVTIVIAFVTSVLTGCAGTYASLSAESSCSSTAGCQIQTREELGVADVTPADLDVYVYHESDPRNGLEGTGWPRETENGVGVRTRVEFD